MIGTNANCEYQELNLYSTKPDIKNKRLTGAVKITPNNAQLSQSDVSGGQLYMLKTDHIAAINIMEPNINSITAS